MSKISVIIPVYNVSAYLSQCINSVLSQTHTDLEIILVNDGSTDNSGTICDEYALKDKRIRVIHKVNGGLSSARNAGLNTATGDYIGFVDSDDYIEPSMYETLLANFDNARIGIVSCGMNLITVIPGMSADNIRYFDINHSSLIAPDNYITFISNNCDIVPIPCAWSKLFKRDLIGDVRFVEGRNAEDIYFLFHLFDNIEEQKATIKLIPEKLYNYYIHSGTISQSKNRPMFVDRIKNLFEIIQDSKAKGLKPEILIDKFMYQLTMGFNEMARDQYLHDTFYAELLPYYKATPLSYFSRGYKGINKYKVMFYALLNKWKS